VILSMLRRMEVNPHATFAEKELLVFSDEFQSAKRDGVVRSEGLADEFQHRGRRLAVVTDEDAQEAIDEDDVEFDAVPFHPEDARLWRLHIPTLIGTIRERNALTGSSGSLTDRLWLLGDASDRANLCAVLALLHEERHAIAELRSLPSLTHDGVPAVVVCPSYAPPVAYIRELASLSVTPTSFLGEDLLIDWRPAGHEQAPNDFTHSVDYRSVVLRGRSYLLSSPQALAIRVLAGARSSGAPDIAWNQLQAQLAASGSHPGRIGDLFKRVPHWRELVVSRRAGFYRLNY